MKNTAPDLRPAKQARPTPPPFDLRANLLRNRWIPSTDEPDEPGTIIMHWHGKGVRADFFKRGGFTTTLTVNKMKDGNVLHAIYQVSFTLETPPRVLCAALVAATA